jgi:hypothetical protein
MTKEFGQEYVRDLRGDDKAFIHGDIVQLRDRDKQGYTLAVVRGVNRRTYQVLSLEPRKTARKTYPAGTKWKVGPGSISKATPKERERGAKLELQWIKKENEKFLERKEKLAQFRIGSRVQFDARGETIVGTVIRINKKSISVQPNDEPEGRYWRVGPNSLKAAE